MLDDQRVISILQAAYIQHYPDKAASILERLSSETLSNLILTIPYAQLSPAFNQLPPDVLAELCILIDDQYINDIFNSLPIKTAARVTACLDNKLKNKVFNQLPSKLKTEIREILKYPPGTAGYLMDPTLVIFKKDMTVEEAIIKVKKRGKKGMRLLFIIDDKGKLESVVPIQELLTSDSDTKLSLISKPVPIYINDMLPQDEIVEQISIHKMTDIPVVDINHHLVGIMQNNTLMRLTKEELTKDIQMMVGVSVDERALSKVNFAVRKRLPWLEVNLLTAFLAAGVVGLFEETIAQFTALAVLLPIVAGQSGNTGAQALAVTMRGLALKEVHLYQWIALIIKEIKIASITGILVSLPTALGVYIWSRSKGLTLVIGISMVISMILAGISGAAVPLILRKLNQDPAVASSIILTTVTDVTGFVSFLGIATLLSKFI